MQVTLRGRKTKGVVVALRDQASSKFGLRSSRLLLPVLAVIERGFVERELVALMHWVSQNYWATMGEVLNTVLPQGMCGYRPRLHHVVDTSQLVVCDTTPGASFPAFAESRFAVLCSCRTAQRAEIVGSFVEARIIHGAVLVLLPQEKSGQWWSWLAERFGQNLVEYHSGLSPAQLKRAWRHVRTAERPLVVGVRSAVFAPVRHLAGIVVVDEHSRVYKEGRHPRYHARDVAIARAKVVGCPVLLCDRTPSAETYFNLRAGTYSWLERPAATGTRQASFIVDMHAHRGRIFSLRLEQELVRALDSGIAILYVNRRGLSRHVACQDCGNVLTCVQCGVPLVLEADQTVGCGMCGRVRAAPEQCPACNGTRFQFRAPGIELVAREVQRIAPTAGVTQVSADTGEPIPGKTGSAVVGTLALLSRTWPAITRLVAAVCFDYDLVVPDFRARERAFQTLYELERRARQLSSRLVVQTWRPDDPAVRAAIEQDPVWFLEQELESRRQLGFPPARRLALIEFRSRDLRQAQRQAERIARLVSKMRGVDVLGPVPVVKRAGSVASRLLVRFDFSNQLDRFFSRSRLESRGVEVMVDVDPLEVV